MCSHAAVTEAQLHFSPVAGDPGRNKLLHNSSPSRAVAQLNSRYTALAKMPLCHPTPILISIPKICI